jgi:hypothetical protein
MIIAFLFADGVCIEKAMFVVKKCLYCSMLQCVIGKLSHRENFFNMRSINEAGQWRRACLFFVTT